MPRKPEAKKSKKKEKKFANTSHRYREDIGLRKTEMVNLASSLGMNLSVKSIERIEREGTETVTEETLHRYLRTLNKARENAGEPALKKEEAFAKESNTT